MRAADASPSSAVRPPSHTSFLRHAPRLAIDVARGSHRDRCQNSPRAITAQAPASSAILACSTFMTSMMTLGLARVVGWRKGVLEESCAKTTGVLYTERCRSNEWVDRSVGVSPARSTVMQMQTRDRASASVVAAAVAHDSAPGLGSQLNRSSPFEPFTSIGLILIRQAPTRARRLFLDAQQR